MLDCPICNLEMKFGYIMGGRIDWIPKHIIDVGGPGWFHKKDKSEGFIIRKIFLFRPKLQPSYYCKACDKIIIDCKAEPKYLPIAFDYIFKTEKFKELWW